MLRTPVAEHSAREAYFNALVQEMEQFRRSQNEVLEMLGGLVRNHVLTCEVIILGADGFATRQWHIPCASVAISPAKLTAQLTVISGTATGAGAPSNGIGMGIYGIVGVPANATFPTRVFNISAREITVYGAVGDIFTLQASTRPQPPT